MKLFLFTFKTRQNLCIEITNVTKTVYFHKKRQIADPLKEEARLPLLFFCNLLFYRVTNRPMFSKQKLWVQIDWASVSNVVEFQGHYNS
jgi:hypothetical protein